MPYGIDDRHIAMLQTVFRGMPEVERVLMFGSRARGDFNAASDIDLAVAAPGLDFSGFLGLKAKFEELPLVYKIDLVHMNGLEDHSLREKIARDGVLFYERNSI
ncbi:MAG: nucleotidyltransferase domain-containing protein [Alphaproteobacteria bacterium]